MEDEFGNFEMTLEIGDDDIFLKPSAKLEGDARTRAKKYLEDIKVHDPEAHA